MSKQHKIKATDPEVFKYNQDLQKLSSILRKAIKFNNVNRIPDIIESGQKVIVRSDNSIDTLILNTWNELVARAWKVTNAKKNAAKNLHV